MTNTMLCGRLPAPPIHSSLSCCKLSFIHPSNIRFVSHSHSHSQTHFPEGALSELKLPGADITRTPKLEHSIEQSINLFKKRGFTDVQIAKIMRIMPQLIGCPETTLEPKLQLLEDFGFVDQDLGELLSRSPVILRLNLKNNLLPKLEFLKDVFQSDDVLVKTLLRGPVILSRSLEKTLKPSIAFWEELGLSGMELISFLKLDPIVLTWTSLKPAKVDFINKFGADKNRKFYKYIVSTVAVSRVETLEEKIENLKLCGLSAEETWQLLRSYPRVITRSKESVREKMNYVVSNMELPANYVVKHPSLLLISLEKTLKPRFLVWQKIKSIDGSELPLMTLLTMSKTRFVNEIIEKHPESKLLWRVHETAISNASKRTKSLIKHTFRWTK